MGWGGFVTSINAGLAVPDWPTSFGSSDMLNPWPDWWKMTPVLAEHGHRLLGTLVGFLTIIIAIWTFWKDSRKWMRMLGIGALVLVIGQGVLGGLRVTLVSLDLAVVHACVAQIFLATIFSMALFTSKSWLTAARAPAGADSVKLRGLAAFSTTAVFIQIVFGALLRHPGTGIDTFLATTHIIWAFVGCPSHSSDCDSGPPELWSPRSAQEAGQFYWRPPGVSDCSRFHGFLCTSR